MQEGANSEAVWGQSRLFRMNRKGPQEGMSVTRSHSGRKTCVAQVSEQGAIRAGRQVTWGLGGNCEEFGFYCKCIDKQAFGEF